MKTVEIVNGNGDRFYWRMDHGLVNADELDKRVHDASQRLKGEDSAAR